MRAALYNTKRNAKKRIAVNPPVRDQTDKHSESGSRVDPSAAAEPIDISDEGSRHATDVQVPGKSGNDDPPRAGTAKAKSPTPGPSGVKSKKQTSTVKGRNKQGDREDDDGSGSSGNDGEDGEEMPTPDTSPVDQATKAAKKRRTSAENPPVLKRSKAMVPKVFDHILAMGDANANLDDIITMLVTYADQHGHRRGYKTACKHLRNLAAELQDLDGDDDWITAVLQYKDALKKLPVGIHNS